MDISTLQEDLRAFADERDWEQFHSPKNLAMAVAVEAAELMEHFQWLTDEQSRRLRPSDDQYAAVVDEVADVLIYLLRFAAKLEIDLERAVIEKMRKNAEKYPVHSSRGNAVKYNRRKP